MFHTYMWTHYLYMFMKFAPLYKSVALTLQDKYINYTMTRLLMGFVQFVNNLSLTLE